MESKQERNSVISLAYAEDGYSQIEIANFLGLSKSAISMIIKSDKSGDWTVGVWGLKEPYFMENTCKSLFYVLLFR